jgi:hypothetical protein
MIPSPEDLQNIGSVLNELKKQFGLTEADNFEGLIPLALLLYGPAKTFMLFLHNAMIIEGQVMTWLENAGSDLQSAVSTLKSAAAISGPSNPAQQASFNFLDSVSSGVQGLGGWLSNNTGGYL